MSQTNFFFIGCDTAVVLAGLVDDTNTLCSNATAVGALFQGNTPVAGGGSIAVSPVGGTPGSYQCTVPAVLDLLEAKAYSLYVTFTFPSTKTLEVRITRNSKVIDL